ncbi:MAG: subfamily B ATP-binding cassette protein MsbA, partial [bacterium]
MKQKTNNDSSTLSLTKRLVKGYLTPHKGRLSIAVICMIIVAICTALTAKMMQPILDELLIAGNRGLFFIVPAIVVTIFFVKGIAGYF